VTETAGDIGGPPLGPHRRDPGAPQFPRLIEALRQIQERITAADAPSDVVTEVAETLEKLSATLEPFAVPEADQVAGHRLDLPGRGQTLVPPYEVQEWDAQHVLAHVRLTRFYLGSNHAAHGGVLCLLFDEILGRLASTGRAMARTAYLHVNYRTITPIGARLRLEAAVERVEGRKCFVSGRMLDGDTVTADAEGLFVVLGPGQP
jgi:acyl-coenzyme A thioesterase PaaI-like protein